MTLSVDDLGDVQKEVFDARAQWYNIGLGLRVPPGTLNAIRSQFRDRPDDCLRETLQEWLKQTDPNPTWSRLVEALRRDDVGEQQLAKTLEARYCSPEEVNQPEGMWRGHPSRNSVVALTMQKIIGKL